MCPSACGVAGRACKSNRVANRIRIFDKVAGSVFAKTVLCLLASSNFNELWLVRLGKMSIDMYR